MTIGTFSDALNAYGHWDNAKGTDKTITHSYDRIYNPIMEALRARARACTVLEIGIYSGASLQAIADFVPNAEIHGIDITLKNQIFAKDHPRIHVYEMDGTQKETADHVGKQFDLIIEDGSHFPLDQVQTLDVFAPYLAPGGVYILEDIEYDNVTVLKPTLLEVAERHQLTMEWIDLRHLKNRSDDIVAIFRRPKQV